MRFLDLTLATAEENLALDEALLEDAEEGLLVEEVLRFWESPQPFVVVGRSSRIADEVDEAECVRRRLPILRRASGGAAVVVGPGCLMYALVLSQRLRPGLATIPETHRTVLGTTAAALQNLVPGIRCRGTSDLAVGERKVSGNSLRVKRTHVLYHGTLLYDLPLDLLAACLRVPQRQPDYRGGRSHLEFVANLGLPPTALRTALAHAWGADSPLESWPRTRVQKLVGCRYTAAAWNRRP